MKLRIPNYLSPSSLSKFESNRSEFFEKYLSPIKMKRYPQINYMAAGSGFDAKVKSEIHTAVHGEAATKTSMYNFETLFESQVEPHVRDEVRERCMNLWDQYVKSGAYGNLLDDILDSPYAPEMEFTIQGVVQGVPLLGKPDLRYVTKEGVHVIADWKVNGAFSATGASPVQGYRVSLDTYDSKTHGKSHKARRLKADPPNKKYKDYTPFMLKDIECNQYYLEEFSPDWADQLAIYSWLLGEDIGSEDYVVRMEQIACRPVKNLVHPRAKFATHMARISKGYQESVLARVKMCWATIEGGHIFTDSSRERSDEICEQLLAKAKTPVGLHPALAKCLTTNTRFK